MSAQNVRGTAHIKSAMLTALPEMVRQWLPDGEQRGDIYFARNPLRDDRNLGSFQINTRTGRWRDHALGKGGSEAVSLYAYLFMGDDYRAAFKALAKDSLVIAAKDRGTIPPPARAANALKPSVGKIAQLKRTYAQAVGLSGTPAAVYLHGRGLKPSTAWDSLRAAVAHYPGVGAYPAILAPIEALSGSITGLHRTYLTPMGKKLDVPNPRLTLGQIKGGAIRLGRAKDKLIICEGLEDGLTLYQELGIPVWVAGGASFLQCMEIPPEIQDITIAADNDPAGERAAQQAADLLNIGSRTVRILRPEIGFKDFNDQLRGIKK